MLTYTPLEGPPFPTSDTLAERTQLMAELSITCEGKQYLHDHLRYDNLMDAVGNARLQLASRGQDDSDRAAMTSFNITLANGAYHFLTYKYDRLADAINYAKLLKRTGRLS